MSTYKRGNVYWYKFMWQGKLIAESTKQGNDKVARNMESAHRTSLAKGEVGIREKKVPTLKDFLRTEFLPFAETKHAAKPMTYRYYKQGSDMLTKSALAGLHLDEITDQHAHAFAAKLSSLSPSGINRGLRTLRRALNLAYQWQKVDRLVKISLAQGEHQRDRVLTQDEATKYLAACLQPWRDCATIILDEGFRPGEVFALRWPHVLFNDDGTGLIQIVAGKSKAAHRILPMTPRVYALLQARFQAAGKPEDGWIFPATDPDHHINDSGTKYHHKKALEDSGVAPFVPYTLRHTALTRFGEAAGNNVFAVAQIAGHSSLTTTKRYVHPQAESINQVFKASQVGTKLGTVKKSPKKRALKPAKQKLLKPA
ncbi:MAG TPA: site-specific integrase [Candidatus Sulfotelmatobacter sp.]|nr:site-specific integrase [Candidatus Sulfotelmatobacter sp.]